MTTLTACKINATLSPHLFRTFHTLLIRTFRALERFTNKRISTAKINVQRHAPQKSMTLSPSFHLSPALRGYWCQRIHLRTGYCMHLYVLNGSRRHKANNRYVPFDDIHIEVLTYFPDIILELLEHLEVVTAQSEIHQSFMTGDLRLLTLHNKRDIIKLSGLIFYGVKHTKVGSKTSSGRASMSAMEGCLGSLLLVLNDLVTVRNDRLVCCRICQQLLHHIGDRLLWSLQNF